MPSIELTDLFVKSAKAATGRQTDYFDGVVRGLYLRVSQAGGRSFNLMYSRPGDGRRVRMRLGRYPDVSLAEARQLAKDARAMIQEGSDPVAQRQAAAAGATVADLVDNYLRRRVSSRKRVDEIARRLNHDVIPAIGSVRLADLHRRDLTRVIDAVVDRGAPAAANRLFDDLRAMCRWARFRGDLDDNLVEGMERPAPLKKRDRVLDADEIKTMWSALEAADMWSSTKRIIRLCLLTAQRVGEVAGIAADELDLDTCLWSIPGTRTKNGEPHDVPLSDMACAILAAQVADQQKLARRQARPLPDAIFPGPGGRGSISNSAVGKAILRQLDDDGLILGIPPWRSHDLRRTASTRMAELGVPPHIVDHILNHVSATRSSVRARHYDQYDYSREKREALKLWGDRLAGIIQEGAQIAPLRATR